MTVKIGHASIDENGRIHSGVAGDQTGSEVCIRNWYAKGWNKVIRAKDAVVAENIAIAMGQACANNKIGYDQYQRTTLYTQAKANGWDLSKITVACECDCSSLVAVCVNAAGITVSKDIYTGNQAVALKTTGKFDILTDAKYLNTDEYLKRGDILLKEGSHTAVALTNGLCSNTNTPTTTTAKKAVSAKFKDKSSTGTYMTTANLNMRTDAGTSKPIILTIPKGDKVQNYGYFNKDASGKKWLYVSYKDITGYCSSSYLDKQ